MKSHDNKLKTELVSRGFLTNEQCQKINEEAQKNRSSFKEEILRLGLMKESEFLTVESDILGVPFLDLDQYTVDTKVLSLIPEKVVRSHSVLPVFKLGKLTVATSDPSNILVLDEVKEAAGGDIELVLSPRESIERAIDHYYGGTLDTASGSSKANAAGKFTIPKRETPFAAQEAAKEGEEMPVINLVNSLFANAIREKASDIHIEPEESIVRIRNRVDGAMHETGTFVKKLHSAIASRIKIMAKLDISETRKPQDGKIRLKIENRDFDIRVSTFPTTHGENIVLRLLEQSKLILGLKDLGMPADLIKQFETLIHKPYGMILVTGPTGSGKTTTLYAALNTINTMDKNIITIEDPVEYQLDIIRQTQVNPKAGITFATGLRSILRQDPDVILVGEIRDSDTVSIAIEAALTGHLVFSTIHTNDASGAITRLIDMGTEPFLITGALIGIVAQRLVRGICDKCREGFTIDGETLKKLGVAVEKNTFYRGRGCAECKKTGYGKRIGVFEMLLMDEPIRNLIIQKASFKEIKSQAMKRGMITMREDGVRKAEKGLTTIEEVLKATAEED